MWLSKLKSGYSKGSFKHSPAMHYVKFWRGKKLLTSLTEIKQNTDGVKYYLTHDKFV